MIGMWKRHFSNCDKMADDMFYELLEELLGAVGRRRGDEGSVLAGERSSTESDEGGR